MAKTPEQMLAVIVDAVQPHCDEVIETAIMCSRPGALGSTLLNAVSTADVFSSSGNGLPPTTIVAVGPTTIVVFEYKPKGFKVKVKDGSEVARLDRRTTTVEVGDGGMMTSQFALVGADAAYAFEVTTVRGAREAFDQFIEVLQRPV